MPKKLIAVLLTLLMLCYPFAVMWAIRHDQLFLMSAMLIVVAGVRLLLRQDRLFLPLTSFAVLCGGLSLLLQDEFWLKFYPVLMSLGSASVFAYTLFRPPSMIERFARLHQPHLPESGVHWTRQVTKVWCGFLIINALVALLTVFLATSIWAIYNGFISYLLMGVLLLGEYLLRRRQQKKQASEHASEYDHDAHRTAPDQSESRQKKSQHPANQDNS